jgi:biopolymer transport protein ExbB
LGVVANLAPMLGFLGTVMGMIKAFNAIAAAGTSNPGLVASGISEALLTTAAGLLVGIPALALFHFFRGRADQLITAMEAVSLELLEELTIQRTRPLRVEEQTDAL